MGSAISRLLSFCGELSTVVMFCAVARRKKEPKYVLDRGPYRSGICGTGPLSLVDRSHIDQITTATTIKRRTQEVVNEK